jgi:hypothetical protein
MTDTKRTSMTARTTSMTARTTADAAGRRSLTASVSAVRQRVAAQNTSRPLTRTEILDRMLLQAHRKASQE